MLFEDFYLTGRSAVLPACPFFVGLKLTGDRIEVVAIAYDAHQTVDST
jgi:hypothetical protein